MSGMKSALEQMPVAVGVSRCLGCELFFRSGRLLEPQPEVGETAGMLTINGQLFSHSYCAPCAEVFRQQHGVLAHGHSADAVLAHGHSADAQG